MALEQAGVQLVAAGGDVYISTMNSATNITNTFVSATESGGGRVSGAGQIMVGALREVGKVAVDALDQAARAAASFVKDSVSVAGNFQQEFAQFQIAVGHTIDGTGLKLNDFKDLFISLGKELPVSTAEVEQAAVEMARGGIDPAVIAAGGLRQTIQFASAALKGDLVSAAQISAKTMQAWTNITDSAATKTDFLTHAQNLMTQATTAASTTVDQLFLGLSNVGGTARLAGVSFDETVKALAQLTPAFASSADAGTSFKTFLARLQPSTKPAIAAMQDLGLITEQGNNKFYDAQGNFVGMAKAEALLQDATKGLSPAMRELELQTIFGNDAIRAAGVFAMQGEAGYNALSASIAKQTTLTDAAKINQDTYNTAVENAKGSVEALQITIGSALLPVLTDLFNNTIAPGVNTITTFASALFGSKTAFDSLSLPLQSAASYVADLGKAFTGVYNGTLSLKTALDVVQPGLGKIVDWSQQLNTFLTKNISIIEGVAAAFGGFVIISTVVGWVTSLGAAFTAAGAAFTAAGGGITAVVALLGGPVTLAIAGVAAAIGVLVVAWQNDWGGIQEKATSVWTAIQPTLATLETWLATNIPVALQKLSTFWTGTLQPALITVGSYIKSNIFPILSTLADTYLAATAVELRTLSTVWTTVLQPALTTVWGILRDDVIPIIAALVNVNIAALQLALRALTGVWQKELQPALTAAGDYISTNLGPTLKNIGSWMSDTFGPTLKSVTGWLNDTTGGFTGMGNAIQGTIKWLNDLASSISNLKLPDWATPGSPTPWEIALRGIGDALATEVVPGVNQFGASLATMGTAAGVAGNDITATLGKALTGGTIVADAKTLGKNAIEGLVAGMQDNFRAIDAVAGKVANKVEDAFGSSFQAASPAGLTIPFGGYLVDGLVVGIQNTMPALNSLVDQMGSTLIMQLGKVSTDVATKISDMVNTIQAKVKDAVTAVANLRISGFQSAGSIDQQKLSNLDSLNSLGDQSKTQASSALADAEAEAKAMNDPKQAADYYAMRSDQILKLAALQDKLNNDLTSQQRYYLDANIVQYQKDIADLGTQQKDIKKQLTDATMAGDVAQMAMLQAQSDQVTAQISHWQDKLSTAQTQVQNDLTDGQVTQIRNQQLLMQDAEQQARQAFTLQAAQGSQTGDLSTMIQDLLQASISAKGKNITLPGITEDPAIAQLTSLLTQLTTARTPIFTTGGGGSSNSYSQTTNLNMPVYTNQSPDVLQSSMAIAGAALL